MNPEQPSPRAQLDRIESTVSEIDFKVASMIDALTTTSRASTRMADLLAEREVRDKEDRDRLDRRAETEAARIAELDKARFRLVNKATDWIGTNWKLLAIAILFSVNPASFKAAQDMGLLTVFGMPPAVAPAPLPLPAPVADPAEPEGALYK